MKGRFGETNDLFISPTSNLIKDNQYQYLSHISHNKLAQSCRGVFLEASGIIKNDFGQNHFPFSPSVSSEGVGAPLHSCPAPMIINVTLFISTLKVETFPQSLICSISHCFKVSDKCVQTFLGYE